MGTARCRKNKFALCARACVRGSAFVCEGLGFHLHEMNEASCLGPEETTGLLGGTYFVRRVQRSGCQLVCDV